MQKTALLTLLTANALYSTATADTQSTSIATEAPALMEQDFSFSYWLNGMRKNPDDQSPAILCFETGHYGFTLDIEDFSQARFGYLSDELNYTESLKAGAARLEALQPAALELELEINGDVYTAIGCLPALGTHATYPEVARQYDAGANVQHLDARLWESGRFVQHYDLLRLKFENAAGHQLSAEGLLDIVAWPGSLTLTAEVKPEYDYTDGSHHGVVGAGLSLIEQTWITELLDGLNNSEFSVECWVSIPQQLEHPNQAWLLSMGSNDHIGAGFKIKYGKVAAVIQPESGKAPVQIEQTSYAPLPNRWNHLVLSFDGEQAHYYLNGKLQGSQPIDSETLPAIQQLELGAAASSSMSPAKGLYDQVRIWSRALTADEIKAHSKKPAQMASRSGLSFEENFDAADDDRLPEPRWKDATLRVRLKTAQNNWQSASSTVSELGLNDIKRVTLNCDFTQQTLPNDQLSVQVSSVSDGKDAAIRYAPEYHSYIAEVKKVQRDWKTGYTDIRNYDEFEITINNSGSEAAQLPLLFYLRDVANVTGLCPILCDSEGVPLGIPVQLSKNWHDASLGAYLRAYMHLPVQSKGTTTYRLRIPYGFYGTLPTASHAMLSLVGYGGLGRWEQLSIGCWGESMCFDMDMSCVDNTVTDVRMLMGRNGIDGGKWNWTDAAWGGDWLGIHDPKGQKHFFSELKTSYLAHGPCLSDVRYDGCYGSQREAQFSADLSIVRTDDFVRTFQNLNYEFNQELPVDGSWLFKMGGGIRSISPKIAYGNGEGLLKAEEVPNDLKEGEFYLKNVTLEGEGPWWVGFPGGYTNHDKDWGTGSRGLIIRKFEAQFGGTTYTNPTISMVVLIAHPDGRKNIDLLLVPPAGVTDYKKGDRVEMDLEWITLPRVAEDYYGPNEAFRTHLAEHPRSWKTIYREASGNNLEVQVDGGNLRNAYPIVIEATEDTVKVAIKGGVGAVPIRFEGLPSAMGYQLYNTSNGKSAALNQSVHGNDFWQTDYDPKTQSYRMTFNLPLDGIENSTWELRRD